MGSGSGQGRQQMLGEDRMNDLQPHKPHAHMEGRTGKRHIWAGRQGCWAVFKYSSLSFQHIVHCPARGMKEGCATQAISMRRPARKRNTVLEGASSSFTNTSATQNAAFPEILQILLVWFPERDLLLKLPFSLRQKSRGLLVGSQSRRLGRKQHQPGEEVLGTG